MKTRVLAKNSATYVMGRPCHIMHNTAGKASQAFGAASGFDVEDLCVDIFYWFDKSTQRKGLLADHYEFCNLEYRTVMKQVSTRSLSLEMAINRNLQQNPGLKSYFLSDHASQARFKRFEKPFKNQMTELYLMFYSNVLPTFTHLNQFLQREDPCIYLLEDQFNKFLQKHLGRLLKISAIRAAGKLSEVDFTDEDNQLADNDLAAGYILKQKLRQTEDEGDISPADIQKFDKAARCYFVAATEYAISHSPFNNNVLRHAKFVDEVNRLSVNHFAKLFNKN